MYQKGRATREPAHPTRPLLVSWVYDSSHGGRREPTCSVKVHAKSWVGFESGTFHVRVGN